MKLIPGTCSLRKRQENFIGQAEINSYSTRTFIYNDFVDILYLDILLDTEMKEYKSKVYGILDAIGTLGGAFEIISWIVLLLYGSIRKHIYLFSAVNSLAYNTFQNDEQSINEEHHGEDMMINRSRRIQQTGQSRIGYNQTMSHTVATHHHTSTKTNSRIF